MRTIDADAIITALLYDDEHEETQEVKMSIADFLDSHTVEGCPQNGGWISVKDRLPEKNQIVIVSDGEHTWDVGMYKSLCGKPSKWNWKKNTVKTVLWWMSKDGALPEPPKEVIDGDK